MANKTPAEIQAEEAEKAQKAEEERLAAEQKAQEKADADAAKALEQETEAAQQRAGTSQAGAVPGQPPRGIREAQPDTKLADLSAQEIVSSGAPNPDDNVLLAAMRGLTPRETAKPTYEENRWKVGEGHSMVDQWVQGEEIDLPTLIGRLGRNDQEKVDHLNRLLSIGAIVRMSDQEPQGGSPTGPLAPLTAPNRRMETEEEIKILMGRDIQDRIAGQGTAQEVADKKGENAFAVASNRSGR
jgi:hypothetical protein